MVKDHSNSERRNPLLLFRLAARVLLYASSHRQDNTYHGLCYTSRGALASMCTINNTKEGNVLVNDALNTFYLWLYMASGNTKVKQLRSTWQIYVTLFTDVNTITYRQQIYIYYYFFLFLLLLLLLFFFKFIYFIIIILLLLLLCVILYMGITYKRTLAANRKE